jgi:hypothetical protein
LREAYVEGRPNKQIAQRHHLSDATLYRVRRKAIDALALDLYHRLGLPEVAGSSPGASPR